MAWSFNPFTGNLDLTGSSGAVVFEGEVETFADLPEVVGDPPVGSSYLVRTSTGVWLVNRRQAGIWIRRNNTGVRANDWEYGGDYPVTSVNGQTGNVVLSASDVGVNFAAPPAIGNTTAAAGSFTTLTASTSLTLGTSGILSGGTNLIEQRNTTSPQAFQIYNTVSGTNDANYERGFIRWTSNQLRIGTEAAGTGSLRGFAFYLGANDQLVIGDSIVTMRGSAQLLWNGRFVMRTFADGNILFANWAQNGMGRIQLGGQTSSFPALKRDSTTLQVRLADDSAFAPLECGALTLNGNLTASTRDIVTDTTTGTKIATGTTQKLGFWNATPAVQPAAVADATDAASTQARLNDLLARLRTIGIIAT